MRVRESGWERGGVGPWARAREREQHGEGRQMGSTVGDEKRAASLTVRNAAMTCRRTRRLSKQSLSRKPGTAPRPQHTTFFHLQAVRRTATTPPMRRRMWRRPSGKSVSRTCWPLRGCHASASLTTRRQCEAAFLFFSSVVGRTHRVLREHSSQSDFERSVKGEKKLTSGTAGRTVQGVHTVRQTEAEERSYRKGRLRRACSTHQRQRTTRVSSHHTEKGESRDPEARVGEQRRCFSVRVASPFLNSHAAARWGGGPLRHRGGEAKDEEDTKSAARALRAFSICRSS